MTTWTGSSPRVGTCAAKAPTRKATGPHGTITPLILLGWPSAETRHRPLLQKSELGRFRSGTTPEDQIWAWPKTISEIVRYAFDAGADELKVTDELLESCRE